MTGEAAQTVSDGTADGATAGATRRAPARPRHGRVVARALALTVAMFGFGYALVPIYDVICDITGLNGKTGRISEAEASAAAAAAVEREITVEFVANVAVGGSWVFRPNESSMTVVPGRAYTTTYRAENPRDRTVVGQATPSVSPFTAARHFDKTECFCFTRQVFAARGAQDMPVTFVVDPDLPANVDRVTLSYTFFDSPDQGVDDGESVAPPPET